MANQRVITSVVVHSTAEAYQQAHAFAVHSMLGDQYVSEDRMQAFDLCAQKQILTLQDRKFCIKRHRLKPTYVRSLLLFAINVVSIPKSSSHKPDLHHVLHPYAYVQAASERWIKNRNSKADKGGHT